MSAWMSKHVLHGKYMLISHFFCHVGSEVPVQLQHQRRRVALVALANAAVAPESVTIEP